MPEPEPLQLPANVLARIKAMKLQHQTFFQGYLQGVSDCMGLDGQFTVDEATGIIQPTNAQPPLEPAT